MSKYTDELGEDEVIPLYFDKVFKLTFGDYNHVELLNYLLSIVLKKNVKVLSLLNNELIGDNRMNKKNSVDLVCELDNEFVSIEVNTSFGQTVIDRNLSFLFRLESKELKPGCDYKNISKYYQINLNLVDFDGQHFNTCHIKSDNTGKVFSNLVEIFNINVSYYGKLCYDNNEDELTDEEMAYGIIGTNRKSVIDKITKNNEVLKEIGNMVKKFSDYDDVIFEYDREKLMMDDMKQVLTEEVTKKTTLEIARKMKQAGSDANFISEVTGLSIEQIDEL